MSKHLITHHLGSTENQWKYKNKSPETFKRRSGPICSVSCDASSAVWHKVELFYYYEKVNFISFEAFILHISRNIDSWKPEKFNQTP